MATNDERQRALENEVNYIKGELSPIRERLAIIDGHEKKVVWFAGIVAVLFPLITLGFNVYNSNLYKEAIDRSERRIETLSGLLRPTASFVHGVQGEDDKKITLEATIRPVETEFVRYFQVRLRGRVMVAVRGSEGRIVGYNTRVSDGLAEFAARRIDGSIMLHALEDEEIGIRDNESEANGRIVSERAPIAVNINRVAYFNVCEEAERAIEDLVDLQAEVGDVGLLPIFANIEQPASSHTMFDAEVVVGSHPTCSRMPDMEKWIFESLSDTRSPSEDPAATSE